VAVFAGATLLEPLDTNCPTSLWVPFMFGGRGYIGAMGGLLPTATTGLSLGLGGRRVTVWGTRVSCGGKLGRHLGIVLGRGGACQDDMANGH
jgi:hypothetical protein